MAPRTLPPGVATISSLKTPSTRSLRAAATAARIAASVRRVPVLTPAEPPSVAIVRKRMGAGCVLKLGTGAAFGYHRAKNTATLALWPAAADQAACVCMEPALPFGEGGGKYYSLGWIFVNVSSHLIVWPLAYALICLPGIKSIL